MDGDKPQLARRRFPEAPSETWHLWYDDVHVGTIAKAEGLRGFIYWTWDCGFSVNGAGRDHRSGAAATYEDARVAFLAAWAEYLPKRTLEDFDNWRHEAAWTAEKYARWDRGERTAPPWPLPGFVFRTAMRRD